VTIHSMLTVGPLSISLQTAASVLAPVAGLVVLWLVASARRLESGLALDGALGALVIGLALDHLPPVLAAAHLRPIAVAIPLELVRELGPRVAAVAAVLCYLGILRLCRRPAGQYGDALAPSLAVASALLWVAAAFSGEYAGVPAASFLALPLPDRFGLVTARVPIQPVMAGACLLAGLLSLLLARWLRPGLSLCLYAALSSSLMALLDNYLAGSPLFWGAVPVSVVADGVLALAWLLGCAGLALSARQGKPVPDMGSGLASNSEAQGRP